MSNLGNGIGSFVTGLTKGLAARRSMDQADLENQLAERKLKLLEDNQTYERGIGDRKMKILEDDAARRAKEDERKLREFDAESPIRDAERRNKLNTLNDDNEQRTTLRSGTEETRRKYDETRARSIKSTRNADGTEAYTVDGEKAASKDDADKMFEQRHGTFMDSYRTQMVPRIVEGYLKRGDTRGAEAYQKWNQMTGIQSAISEYGRMMQSFELQDWNGVNTHLNKMLKNGDYFNQDRHDIKTEPLMQNGKVVGLRMTYKDKVNNSESSREFKDMNEFKRFAGVIAAPDSVFEQNRLDMAEQAKSQNERAKEKEKLADNILLEREKSDLNIDEDAAKSANRIQEETVKEDGPRGDRQRAAAIRDIWKSLEESGAFFKEVGGKRVAMTPDEQAQLASDTYEKLVQSQTRSNAAQGASPPARPRSVLPAQAAPAAVAPPPTRRVLPPLFTIQQPPQT
jgi:hypothetical protein